jgi:hypothetical protein
MNHRRWLVNASTGWLRQGLLGAALLSLGLGAAPVAVAAPSAAPLKGVGPGCDPDRPAVATHAGGVVLSPQPARGPIPCATVVGTTSEAADVGVLRPGSVFYAPLLLNTSTPPQDTLEAPRRLRGPATVARPGRA